MSCPMCERLAKLRSGDEPFLIHEFEHSVLVVGDHKTFPGYCQLLLKRHERELHDLPEAERLAFFEELMTAGRAVAKAFAPTKMNYSSYGNVVPHLHWHLFPRQEGDRAWPQPPWTRMDQFKDFAVTPGEAREIAARVRAALANP